MTDAPTPLPPLPEPSVNRPGGLRFSLIWLVPLIAAVAGLALVVRTYLQTGPTIHISFETAEGLDAGKTEVRYKDVVIGKVHNIALTPDARQVIVTVQMAKSASRLATADTRFWVVRPRIGIGGISGINTLFSGAYIAADIGESNVPRSDFVGLEKPPTVLHDRKGRRFTLHTTDAGSVNIGAPVYFRRVPVGQVVDASLDEDGRHLTVDIFIEAPYDRFVTQDARFWNAGGIDLSLSSTGFKLNTQSLATVLAGGIAFQPLNDASLDDRADENTDFELYPDKASALAPVDGPEIQAALVFQQSMRGLAVGAPVDFQGTTLGEVDRIEPGFDPKQNRFFSTVVIKLYLQRLGPAWREITHDDPDADDDSPAESERVLMRFIRHGLAAQLRTGNLLTGQQLVVLLFRTQRGETPVQRQGKALRIPTVPGNLEEIQTQIQDIVRKIDAIPFDDLGQQLRGTLADTRRLMRRLDGELAPQARQVLEDTHHAIRALDRNLASPDAPIQQDTRHTLDQLNRAAASLRALSDYLEQHPEAVLRGKPKQPEPRRHSGR